MSVRIERVTAAETVGLRQRVLRPHQTVDQLALAGDDDPDTGHFVALDDGVVIGTASVRREEPPWTAIPAFGAAWRLRGMATAEGYRGQGVGSAILQAIVDHVAAHGGGLLWCNARMPAIPFYQRAGFVTRGEEWVDPLLGPHISMHRLVELESP